MTQRRNSIERGFDRLIAAKLPLLDSSRSASDRIRSCADCDARCCKVGRNSMRVSRIEALALARRLAEPDLAPRIPEIRRRAAEEVERRGIVADDDVTYDCPLLDEDGRCMAHGPAQPAGCLTFKPVADGGCDHDIPLFSRRNPKIEAAEKAAFGKLYAPMPIPLALLKVLREQD